MHAQGSDHDDYRVRLCGSDRSGHSWRLLRGTVLVASSAGIHPSSEAADTDAAQFRRLARGAGYDVLRAGSTWTWRAWHDGVVRAHGAAGFTTEEAARAAAYQVRDSVDARGGGRPA